MINGIIQSSIVHWCVNHSLLMLQKHFHVTIRSGPSSLSHRVPVKECSCGVDCYNFTVSGQESHEAQAADITQSFLHAPSSTYITGTSFTALPPVSSLPRYQRAFNSTFALQFRRADPKLSHWKRSISSITTHNSSRKYFQVHHDKRKPYYSQECSYRIPRSVDGHP